MKTTLYSFLAELLPFWMAHKRKMRADRVAERPTRSAAGDDVRPSGDPNRATPARRRNTS
ncbi:hypothetical protein NKH10_13435 [Mesorhizobium sp. M1340]|uniref:hypothetical protein n=1 Tax=unclassified Mesorhizobium TaxID=325217 RepID=UPI00333D9FD7